MKTITHKLEAEDKEFLVEYNQSHQWCQYCGTELTDPECPSCVRKIERFDEYVTFPELRQQNAELRAMLETMVKHLKPDCCFRYHVHSLHEPDCVVGRAEALLKKGEERE